MIDYTHPNRTRSILGAAGTSTVAEGRRAPKPGPRKVTRPSDLSLRRYIWAASPGIRIAGWTAHVA